MSRNVLLTILCLSYWSLVRADIVFIDVNDSKTEVKQAANIAQKLGVKLWIIPDKSQSSDLTVQLELTLKKMVDEKRSLDSLVVSGHYNGSKFYSKDKKKSITSSQIQKIFSRPEFQEKRMQLNNLLLWGCYSARPVAMEFWFKLFPHLQVLTGFNFAAPSWRTEAGPNLLHEVLFRFSSAMTREALKSQIEEVSNSFSFRITHGLIYDGQCYQSSTLGKVELASSTECPDILVQGLKLRAEKMYYPYLKSMDKHSETERKKICSHQGTTLGRFCIDTARYTSCFIEINKLPKASEVHSLCRKFGCTW